MSNRPILSISILISNRPDTVEKCLKSLNVLREKVPCELILTDTGCGKEVRSIIEPYADVLLDFTWCNDFAKARNLGLSKARGEWFLFLDDDEWFDDTDEIEEFFLSGEYKQYGRAYYKVRNYKDMQGVMYNDTVAYRMAKLTPDVRFEGVIHESLSGVYGASKVFQTYAHHYGYVFTDELQKYKHSKRNLPLLLEEHRKEPYELRYNVLIAQEYNNIKEYYKSIDISLEGIKLFSPAKTSVLFWNALCVNVVERHVRLFRYEEAIEYGERYLADKRITKLGIARICTQLVNAACKAGHYEACIRYAEQYLEIYEDYLRSPEKYEEQASSFMYGCFTRSEQYNVASFATAANFILGNYKKAEEVFRYINFEEKVLTLDDALYEEAVKAYLKADDLHKAHPCVMILNKLLEYPQLYGKLIACFEEARKQNPDMVKEQCDKWQYLTGDCWYISYLKLDTKSEVQQARDDSFRRLWANPEAVLAKSIELNVWELADKAGVDMCAILQEIPYYKWRNAVNSACNTLNKELLTALHEQICSNLTEDDCKALYWKSSYYHKQLIFMKESDSLENGDGAIKNVVDTMIAFAESSTALAKHLYAPRVLSQERELLPEYMQAAIRMATLLEYTEAQDFAAAIKELKVIKELLPGIATAVKIYIKWIETQVKQKDAQATADRQAATAEMQRLEKAVKAQIHAMLQQGNKTVAIQLIAQLEAITGSNEELEMLKEMAK